jgi:hypothetical protein
MRDHLQNINLMNRNKKTIYNKFASVYELIDKLIMPPEKLTLNYNE